MVWRKSCFKARGREAPCLEACSTGLEVGGVHRGERPSWHGSASSLVTFTGTAESLRGRAAPTPLLEEELSLGLEEGRQVGLWRPEEGDLVGVAAFLMVVLA